MNIFDTFRKKKIEQRQSAAARYSQLLLKISVENYEPNAKEQAELVDLGERLGKSIDEIEADVNTIIEWRKAKADAKQKLDLRKKWDMAKSVAKQHAQATEELKKSQARELELRAEKQRQLDLSALGADRDHDQAIIQANNVRVLEYRHHAILGLSERPALMREIFRTWSGEYGLEPTEPAMELRAGDQASGEMWPAADTGFTADEEIAASAQ